MTPRETRIFANVIVRGTSPGVSGLTVRFPGSLCLQAQVSGLNLIKVSYVCKKFGYAGLHN